MSANGIKRIRWRWVVLTRAHRTRRVSACETLRKYYGNVERVEGMLITDKKEVYTSVYVQWIR